MKPHKVLIPTLATALLLGIALTAIAAAPPPPTTIGITQVGFACAGEPTMPIDVHWSPEVFQYTYIVTVDTGSYSETIYNANSPQLFEVPIPSDVTVTVEVCDGTECDQSSEIFWLHGDPSCLAR